MPRPKVHPDNRLRAAKACVQCRTSKKRCSATVPCSNCVRRGYTELCSMFDGDSTEALSPVLARSLPTGSLDTSPTQQQQQQQQAQQTEREQQVQALETPQALVSPASSAQSQVADPPITTASSPYAQHCTQPRILKSVSGEKVYIGGAASLSFLQLIRDTVTQYMGPSSFSNNTKRDTMLEIERQNQIQYHEDPLDMEEKAALFQVYLTATSGVLQIVSNSEATRLLNGRMTGCSAVEDLMLAIGAQCATSKDSSSVEQFYFVRGQQRAFRGMLESPSLEMVRAFILLSFYMMGACRRNAAFIYLGVAARAAVALGLHSREPHGTLREPEQQMRLKVWMSLRVLDIVSSSILGRPSATSMQYVEPLTDLIVRMPTTAEAATLVLDEYLVVSYSVAMTIDEVVGKIYSEKEVSLEAAESLLQQLRQWSEDFHDIVALNQTDSSTSCSNIHILGKMHIACFYYFAVALVTRPFLISLLTSRLTRLHRSSSGPVLEDPGYVSLAFACVDSAVYMIQTCQEIHETGLLLVNMCLLKALIFAAALILGFLMFSGRDSTPEVEVAFSHARTLLAMLSHRSAQAAHYYEILTLLANTIAEQRQRLSADVARSRNHYVSRIFTLDAAGDSSFSGASSALPRSTPPMAPGVVSSPNPMKREEWNRHHSDASDYSLPDGFVGFVGWDSLDLPLWDRFPFATDGLEEGGA